MIIDYTDEELKSLESLEKAYTKLIKEQEDLILTLRPNDPEPDEEEYERLQEQKPTPPPMPELIPTKNGQLAFSAEAMEAYRQSDEYKAYEAERDRIDQEIDKLYDDWYNAGSDEWKAASKKLDELYDEALNSDQEIREKAIKRHFSALGGDHALILKDAKSQVDRIIPLEYEEINKRRESGGVRSKNARAQKDGTFLLDTNEMKDYLHEALERHIKELGSDRDTLRKLDRYIKNALSKSDLVGDTGELGGLISMIPLSHETTEEMVILATRPSNYVTTVDKVSKKVFNNKVTRRENDNDVLKIVPLDSKNKTAARVLIDYSDLLKSGEITRIPDMSYDDYDVLDAVHTHIMAGNRVLSYNMIYRVMTGKMKGNIIVPDEAKQLIDDALSKYRGSLKLEYEYQNEKGETITDSIDEPLLAFRRRVKKDRTKINGQIIDGAIELLYKETDIPPLLRWALRNRNEIDTRDITLLDVKGLNNGEESRRLKMCLYRRIVSMSNEFKRKKGGRYELEPNRRTIRYDYVYDALELKDPDKDKRKLVKKKIDKCMIDWQEKGLIAGYEHIRDKSAGNSFYAVRVSFLPK